MANTKLPARLLDTSAIPALNVTGDLTVDTTTLKVDSTNNRVGIGIASPGFTLEVKADKDTWLSRIYNTGSDANAQTLLVRSDATAAHDALVMGVYADSGYKMVVKSTGNVGIGTTTPTMGVLQVHGSKYVNTNSGKALGGIHVSPDSAATLGQFGGAISLSAGGNGSSAIAAVNDGGTDNDSTGLAFFVHGSGTGSDDATEVVRIDQVGYVGIGDTDPFTKLHVEDTSWSSGAPYGAVASITGNNVNDNNWGHLIVTDSSTANGNGGSIRFGTGTADGSNLNPIAGIQGVSEGTAYGGLALYTRPSGGTATERMRIRSDGTTTIGRAITPTYDNDIGYPLHIQASGGNQTYIAISVPGAASGDTGLVMGHDGTGTRITNREADPMIFGISSSEKMRVHSNGNVGVGNTNPSRALLHVGGNGVTVNTTLDVSKTAIFRTDGTGNYSTSGNGSAAHAATFMRSSDAATGDQVGHSYVFDNGNWSATAEIMAEVESDANAYSRLNFKTWNGSMLTRQVITSDGQVIKPYQSGFYAVKSSAQTVAVNDTIVFNTATENVGADYNTSTGVYTAPYSGFYIFAYTVLFGASVPDNIDIDHYLGTSNRAYIGGMPGRIRYLTSGATGWGDGYVAVGHTQIAYMDANDTANVYCSALTNSSGSNVSLTAYANTGNNWTKFSGYFLG